MNIALKGDDHKNSVMFIHGWRGDKNSFGSLPTYISKNSNIVPLVYSYPTGFWKKSPSLEFVSRDLENWVLNNTISTKRKVALIGHSMGGLVIRRMLANQNVREKPLNPKVKQVTFIASPFSGVTWAKFGTYVPMIRKNQISDLKSDSGFLINLKDSWSAWTNQIDSDKCVARQSG